MGVFMSSLRLQAELSAVKGSGACGDLGLLKGSGRVAGTDESR